jgi:hypothetical protein
MESVAYNPETDFVLVAFQYDWFGDESDWDVFATAVYCNGQLHPITFPVAGTSVISTIDSSVVVFAV